MAEGVTPLASGSAFSPNSAPKHRPRCFHLLPLAASYSSPFSPPLLRVPLRPLPVRCRSKSRLKTIHHGIRAQASDIGAGSYRGEDVNSNLPDGSTSEASSKYGKPLSGISYQMSIVSVLLACAIAFVLIVSLKGGPSAFISALAKSGFTAAFTLIFVSEIGDKTFFIAALLAMQYDKAMVLFGSMAALSLMSILSVVIGRIFNSVPAQFQTTLPLGEYAAVALLAFFGLKSIKNAWETPSRTNNKENTELGELVEAEELVKEKVATKLTNLFEVLWKSFSLVFFAEWGDRSMLATIALGAAQVWLMNPIVLNLISSSPTPIFFSVSLGVAGGAIAGHLFATSIAILGGAFLANYISEKLVGYLGGILFLIFAAATLLGIF